MLDTIILEFPEDKFSIIDSGKFTIAPNVLKRMAAFAKSHNNPTAMDKAQDVYKPRLTLYKRGLYLFLKVEFSAPKMLWRNNVDEICEENFEELVKTLKSKLADMGVVVFSKDIEKADVLSFHPSKNVELNNGYTATYAISELKKADISRVYDWDEKEYRNGKTFQIYSNSFAFVFYDKIYDLNRPKKRATDKDKTKYQGSLFDLIKQENNRLELLRMELRLSKKRKMNKVLKKIGFKENPTLEDIFKKDLCQKILNCYWQEFFGAYNYIFSANGSPQRLLGSILMAFPKIKASQAVKWVGTLILMRDDGGVRELRNILDRDSKHNWPVIKRQIDGFKDKIFADSRAGFIKDIERELYEFKPFRLKK